MDPETDEEFETQPRVNKSTPYARSTNSSASNQFGVGDDDIDDEVILFRQLVQQVQQVKGGTGQFLLRPWLTMHRRKSAAGR